jgi:serine/threonine protein kinase
VARTVEAAAKITRPIGTDAYMAPEQCDPKRAPVGPPADVFGLGATLQYAITGSRTFPREVGARDASDPAVRFPQLSRGPAPLPKRTPAPLADLIAAMLAADPGDRPTAAEVAHALEPVVADLPRRLALTRLGWRRRR